MSAEQVRSFTRGEKARVDALTPSTSLRVGLAVDGPSGQDYDVSCFGLDASRQLSDDRYLVFYNQRSSPEGAITATGSADGDRETFECQLDRLPPTVDRLVFTVTTDGAAPMSSLRQGHLRLQADGQEAARFAFTGGDFAGEKAIIVGELYRKDGWRFAAVGQGFNGGLSALLTHFGGSEMPTPTSPTSPMSPPAPAPATAPAPAPTTPATAAPTPAAPIRLSKVTLGKQGDAQVVDLRKGGAPQPLRVNLNWDQGKPSRGIFGKSTTADLDLGCMFELADGTKGVIQPLGGNFGSRDRPPHILLDKDDRSGASTDGENLTIVRPDLIRRVLVFAMIYEGTKDFTSVGARLTLTDPEGNEIAVRLDSPDPGRTFCAICTVESVGRGVEVTKQERYFRHHEEADQAFGFGFSWKAGRK